MTDLPKPLTRLDELDDLLGENLRHLPRLRREPSKEEKRKDAEAAHKRDEYTDPARWIVGRGIALVHKDSNSLIGNYREYTHYRVPSCRKLLLVKEPMIIDATEYREGSWWMEPLARERVAMTQWDTVRHEVIPLLLDRMGVYSPASAVTIHLRFGGITRVELTQDCDFASPDGAELLHLTKGVNIYEAMAMEGKMALRREVAL